MKLTDLLKTPVGQDNIDVLLASIRPVSQPAAAQHRGENARSVTLILLDEVPVSWNKFYSGVHWAKRSAMKNDIRRRVAESLTGNEKMFDAQIDITFTAYFRGRRIDPDNLCAKLYIDALKGVFLTNDSAVQVRSVKCVCLRDVNRPRLEIKMEAV